MAVSKPQGVELPGGPEAETPGSNAGGPGLTTAPGTGSHTRQLRPGKAKYIFFFKKRKKQESAVSRKPSPKAAAAAAKSRQSCPALCDPIDGSPPGSPIPGILQARTLEWAAISFSNA